MSKNKTFDFKEDKGFWISVAIILIASCIAAVALFGVIRKNAENKKMYTIDITAVGVIDNIYPQNMVLIKDKDESEYVVYDPWELTPEYDENNKIRLKNNIGELAHNVGVNSYIGYVANACADGEVKLTALVHNGEEEINYQYKDEENKSCYYNMATPIIIDAVLTINGEDFEEYQERNQY